MEAAAKEYSEEIFAELREHGYDPELMKLYMMGGGAQIIERVGEYDRCIAIQDDPYLETREKEDDFLKRLLDMVDQKVLCNLPVLQECISCNNKHLWQQVCKVEWHQ